MMDKTVPVSSKTVANYFLDKKDPINQIKLQKLVYFSHGWHLALLNGPLIREEIEAWKYGPVIPSLHYEFIGFGIYPIGAKLMFAEAEPASYLTMEQKHLLDRVWKVYGKFSGVQLSNLAHEKGSPWEKAIENNSAILSVDDMKEYFKKKVDIS